MTLEARAQRNISNDSIDLWLFDPIPGTAGVMGQPISFKMRETQGEYAPPAMRLDYKAAQQLMDELWICGLRPSEGSGSAGSLAATERHLADMRAMAFASLKIAKP